MYPIKEKYLNLDIIFDKLAVIQLLQEILYDAIQYPQIDFKIAKFTPCEEHDKRVIEETFLRLDDYFQDDFDTLYVIIKKYKYRYDVYKRLNRRIPVPEFNAIVLLRFFLKVYEINRALNGDREKATEYIKNELSWR